jgi:hypothetical protein
MNTSACGLLYAIAVPRTSLDSDDTTGRALVHQPAIEHSEQAGLEGVSQKSGRPKSTLPVPP